MASRTRTLCLWKPFLAELLFTMEVCLHLYLVHHT